MNILVACEESQEVCKAFLEKGHNVFSCDLRMCSGGMPGRHILIDVLKILYPKNTFLGFGILFFTVDGKLHYVKKWDMLIAFPPCTYLTNAGNQCFSLKVKSQEEIDMRYNLRLSAFNFVKKLLAAPVYRICIENPVGYLNSHLRKPDQIINPFYFSSSGNVDYQLKRTCLWLYNLPPLLYLADVNKPIGKADSKGKIRYFTDWVGSNRSVNRSKTFPGVARAMAEQWSNL